jgi:PAS domain S-box-containing protein
LRYRSAPRGRAIHARKLADEVKDPYRGMFEHALWGMFQTTRDGQYIRANAALAQIYGYETPAALMTGLIDIGRQLYVDPARRAEFVRLMQENRELSGFESEIYRSDGSIIWISESCREVWDEHGIFVCYEGTVENISDRKQIEAELYAAREIAEQSNKAKSVFLANMSHELRTPLNAIMGFSELMTQELFGPLGDPHYAEFAGDIFRSGKHLLEIIGDILDLAKVETGQLGLDEREVEVVGLVHGSERLIAESARHRDITLEVIVPDGPVRILADSTRLRQILLNLLSNAVKFTPEHKSVALSCGRDGDALFLRVADTGIGMKPEDLVKVMQPFHQVDNSLSRRYEGTGLGLPLTQSLVDLHGGTMTIESVPDQGTTITVRLPASRVLDWGPLAPILKQAG